MEQARTVTVVEGNGVPGILFGIPFALIGLGVALGGIYGVVFQQVPWVVLAMLIPFGGIFFCVGAVAGWGKHELTIDAERSTTMRSWGVFLPFKKNEAQLGKWDHVGVERRHRRTQKSSYVVYAVFLARPGDSFPISEPRDYQTARALAERVAKACQLGMRDAAGADVVVREAGTLDMSLRERLRASKHSQAIPKQPEGGRATVSNDMGTTVIDVPASGLRSSAGFMIAAIVLGSLGQALIVKLSESSVPLEFFLLEAAVAPALIVPLTLRCFTREQLKVSAASMELIRQAPMFERKRTLSTTDIEELRLGPPYSGWFGSGIVLVTDKGMHTVATSLSGDEQQWLAAVIKRALST